MQVSTHSRCTYFITFIDDMSRYCHVYLIKYKLETLDKFIRYKTFVEKQTNHQIKILRSNHGGEYMSNDFKEFCKKKGIKHELTTSYTPQQNGVYVQFLQCYPTLNYQYFGVKHSKQQSISKIEAPQRLLLKIKHHLKCGMDIDLICHTLRFLNAKPTFSSLKK